MLVGDVGAGLDSSTTKTRYVKPYGLDRVMGHRDTGSGLGRDPTHDHDNHWAEH